MSCKNFKGMKIILLLMLVKFLSDAVMDFIMADKKMMWFVRMAMRNMMVSVKIFVMKLFHVKK